MKFLRDFSFKNKHVLVRADFNVPLGDDSQVDEKEDWRLKAVLPTINYLLKQKAKIILLTHLGRPRGKIVKELRLNPIAQRLEELLNQKILKLDDCIGPEIEKDIDEMKAGKIILLENLRFYPEEKENSPDFTKQLARLGDFYVNDAFGTSHRTHASIIGLPKYLPSCAGLLLEKEINNLSKILNELKHPLLVIIGGKKISTKIKFIEIFLKKADDLILGGALANTAIRAKGFAIGKSIIEEEMIDQVKKLELTNIKLHLPVDAVASIDISGDKDSRIAPIGKTSEDEMILDIGPDSEALFKEIIFQAKMIIWNGPMGIFEIDKFASGSREIAKAVAQSSSFSVVGGGDTIVLLEQMNLFDQIDHISTGGGAMLKFLAGERLPGIEALKL